MFLQPLTGRGARCSALIPVQQRDSRVYCMLRLEIQDHALSGRQVSVPSWPGWPGGLDPWPVHINH